MNLLQSFFEQLPNIRPKDILDVLIVALLFYILLPIFRSTGTTKIAWVVAAVVAMTSIAGVLKLHTLRFLLGYLLEIGLLALVVLFQPEIRRALDHITKIKVKNLSFGQRRSDPILPVIEQTVRACEIMGKEKVGALIVFARTTSMDEYFKTGTILDAQVTEQLIRNVFFPKASLHDGAMIIRDGRMAAAGCVLPLSESDRLHADLGTRHRAGVGMSEVSDAVVVIVSEETGVISVAVGGVLKRHLAPKTLESLLKNELCEEPEQDRRKAERQAKRTMKKEAKASVSQGGDEDA